MAKFLSTIGAATAFLTLAGCGGGGGGSALIEACVEEGETRKNCACMAEKLEEGLSPKAFKAAVLSAEGKDEEAEALMEDLSMGESMSMIGTMMTAAQQCGVLGVN